MAEASSLGTVKRRAANGRVAAAALPRNKRNSHPFMQLTRDRRKADASCLISTYHASIAACVANLTLQKGCFRKNSGTAGERPREDGLRAAKRTLRALGLMLRFQAGHARSSTVASCA